MYLKILHALRRFAGASAILAAVSAWAISPEALRARLEKGDNVLVIDLRPAVAYEGGHIPGALNIPITLLPMKPLPANAEVVVYGDGLGLVDDVKAAAAIRAKPGVRGDVLVGGYAAWLESTRLTTAPVGVERERLPGITYNQLLSANRSDMVLVDLRGVGAATVVGEDNPGAPRRAQQTSADASGDLLAGFAAKLGIPLVAGGGGGRWAYALADG
jgi:rhodanese-related sulfurtransferase